MYLLWTGDDRRCQSKNTVETCRIHLDVQLAISCLGV